MGPMELAALGGVAGRLRQGFVTTTGKPDHGSVHGLSIR